MPETRTLWLENFGMHCTNLRAALSQGGFISQHFRSTKLRSVSRRFIDWFNGSNLGFSFRVSIMEIIERC
jgi:hypothetical protein